ncbi:MAG: aminoacetone oxidase family FAD-binding enzyme [Anaerovoracaceae bacterium]|jgi:predicted Rossmann fold flavoprotein
MLIIGAGAAGLFAAAMIKTKEGILLEAGNEAGRKLLLSGGGQCNMTHSGDIREFVRHYGDQGKKLRSTLYKASNLKMVDFFREGGLKVTEREDGKIFPQSLSAVEVRDFLLQKAGDNGWRVLYGEKAEKVELRGTGWLVNDRYETDRLLVASGGRSYAATGSDGSMFKILGGLGLELVKQRPALTPVFVQDYPFADLSGISFPDAKLRIKDGEKTAMRFEGSLLLTHRNFSGPLILDASRYLETGDTIEIGFYSGDTADCRGVDRSLARYIAKVTGLPERFVEKVIEMEGTDAYAKASTVAGGDVKRIFESLHGMRFSISGKAGYERAMVTAGGVSLREVDLKTFECKKHPGLYLAGEVLDVDGDTGGYNLQFAFSSAAAVARACQP